LSYMGQKMEQGIEIVKCQMRIGDWALASNLGRVAGKVRPGGN